MRIRSLVVPTALALAAIAGSACSQTPTVVPLRSMERPKDVDFICLQSVNGGYQGVPLERCALSPSGEAPTDPSFRLHAVVTQLSRGELAVADLGRAPGDDAALVKVDPRLPGYTFIPVGAAPADVVVDPLGEAVFVASGRDPRIDIGPWAVLRGPLDTNASADDVLPWPHLDFDRATEGLPGALTIVREGDSRRLYVTLPDAQPLPKIAVFDLDASPLLPPKVGDIELTVADVPPTPFAPPECRATQLRTVGGVTQPVSVVPEPWWVGRERQCAGTDVAIPTGEVSVPPTGPTHLAGVAVAGGKLFVADDKAPYIHVFDVEGGRGRELTRIAVGSPTSQIAVSPIVPDEVTVANSTAIEVCALMGWLGDGLDHSADSPAVAAQLGGRCTAHRYLYAIDLANPTEGNGSIAVIDVPVVTRSSPDGAVIEELDRSGASAGAPLRISQPLACDAPSFPARRIPLGASGLGGLHAVPVRSVVFSQNDPPIGPSAVTSARCHPWNAGNHPLAANGVNDITQEALVPQDRRDAYADAAFRWRTGVRPDRLRGVFAYVALMNGGVVVIDLDDYDSLCRGPQDAARRGNAFKHPFDELTIGLGPGATNEYYPYAVRRHHPRSLRAFDDNLVPSTSAVVLSRFGSALPSDPTAPSAQPYPHFAALAADESGNPVTLVTAPDNPYALNSETWQVTYEGELPGFSGAFGAIVDEGGVPVLQDPSVGFCRQGVEAQGPVDGHDVIQLVDEVCTRPGQCTDAQRNECLDQYGAPEDQPRRKGRSLVIGQAFQDRVTLARHWALVQVETPEGPRQEFQLRDGLPANLRTCFGDGVLRYAVRPQFQWVVVGSLTGYLHRWTADPTTGACVLDPTRPSIQQGRLGELPPLGLDGVADTFEAAVVADPCQRFTNTSWQFAIRQGRILDESGAYRPAASEQDMRFTFSARWAWQPFSVNAGALPTAIELVGWSSGRNVLGWNMIAIVDSVDRGLFVFPAFEPYTAQKVVN